MIQTHSQVDVVVAGAGMSGATLACALTTAGLRVAVIESRKAPTWNSKEYDLRVSAINLASENILATVGVWLGIQRKRVSLFHQIETWDESSLGKISFDAADAGLSHLGHIIENTVMTAALHEKLGQLGVINLHYGTSVDQWTTDDGQVMVTTDKGQVIESRLLVGADGALSHVRETAGIGLRKRPYRHTAIVANVTTEKSHHQTARQRFLSTGPLAFLPLADGRSSIVWSADSCLVEKLAESSDDSFRKQLATAFGDRLGTIDSVSRRLSFPLVRRHADQYIDKRVALIGDAAHTVHPLAGLGANQGIADAATLGEVLIDSVNRGRDIGGQQTLRRYERWRRGENQLVLDTLDGLYHLFGTTHPLVTSLRGLGLNLTDRVRPIKNVFLRRATGLSGDLPRMAKPPAA